MRGLCLGGEARRQRHRTLPHCDDLAGHRDDGRLRQNELRLARADQFVLDLGQKFGIKQRAMLGASRIIDGVSRA
jgi:hypothetical protein